MHRTIAIATVLLALAVPASASAAPSAKQTQAALAAFTASTGRLTACPLGQARCINRAIWATYEPVRTLVYGLPRFCKQDAQLGHFQTAAAKLLAAAVGSYMLPTSKPYATDALSKWIAARRALTAVHC